MRAALLLSVVALVAGCNQLLGLDPIESTAVDGAADGVAVDSSRLEDGAIDGLMPGDGATPIDASPLPIDAAWQCTTDLQCGTPTPGSCVMPACLDHVCVIGPAPRNTFCNGFADQCDGAGNCVDCTNSGGCGECCVCFNETCINA